MYKRFQELMLKIADVNYATAVLMWDQETYMPKDGEHYRSQQISTLSGIAHDLFTSKELIELVATLQEDASLNEDQKLNVVETARVLNKKKKLTTAFVMEMSTTVSETFMAWQKAKQNNAVEDYLIHLEKLVLLKREEASLIGYKTHPYDALIDEYEPGMTVLELDKLFEDVKVGMKKLLDKINAQLLGQKISNSSFSSARNAN